MAEFRIPLQYSYGRSAADSKGTQPAGATSSSFLVGSLTEEQGNGYELLMPIPLDAQILRAQIWASGATEGVLETLTGRADWQFGFDGVAGSMQSNGGIPALTADGGNRIVVSGPAAAAFAVTGTDIQVVAEWRRGPNGGVAIEGLPVIGSNDPQFSAALFAGFADDQREDNPAAGDLRGLYSRTEILYGAAGGSASTINRAGQPLAIAEAAGALADPWGRVVLTSSDLGNGPGQIPTTRSTWLSSQFANHPQVFIRRPEDVRGISAATRYGAQDLTPLTGSPAQMRLYTVERPPAASTWLCIVDGQEQTITFLHPDGSDFRRPADIWNGVIIPAINTLGAVATPGVPQGAGRLPLYGTANGIGPAMSFETDPGTGVFTSPPTYPDVRFYQRGALPRRLGFLTYARILHLWDPGSPYPGGNPIMTEVQTTA